MTVGLCTLDMLMADGPLDELSAVFVAASLVLGLEHLHWSHIMYRYVCGWVGVCELVWVYVFLCALNRVTGRSRRTQIGRRANRVCMCVCVCVCVTHRGLSVHSVLVTEGGQIQLVDFRFARKDDSRAYTLCGNPE